MKELFRKISNKVSQATGSAPAFLIATLLIVAWAFTKPLFEDPNTWQLVINTGTTIGTFLMVFLIQNTQNRDSKAMQLKLDELIRATRARDAFVDLEDLSDEELSHLDKQFQDLRTKQASSQVMKKMHDAIRIEHEMRKSGHKLSAENLNKILKKITDY
jgi:low affinity Fe/Cu permease